MTDIATLRTLLRVRKQVLDAARQELSSLIDAESTAAERYRAASAAMQREYAVATALDASDAVAEAFATWLPHGREAVAGVPGSDAPRGVARTIGRWRRG